MTSRISGWFVLSAVFIVAVFGLFFTFTERKTWPEHRIELSASDQRLIPPASTVWCEAIAIYSEHPFVAYQVSRSPLVHPSHLSRQKVSVSLKLGGGKSRNSFKLKYFLLQSSVLELFGCASQPGAKLLVFKGEEGVQEYMQRLSESESLSDESYSIESSFEEEEEETSKLDCSLAQNKFSIVCKRRKTSTLLSETLVPVDMGDSNCNVAAFPPVKINVTTAGFYVIAVLNTNSRKANYFNLQLLIDRSRYAVIKSGHSLDMCSLSTTCTIGLSFASDDSALVWIPEEPNAGRSTFTVRSRCKPRLAVFAILSVFLPLMFFVLVAFFVRADRERLKRIYTRSTNSCGQQVRTAAAPLLRDDVPRRAEQQFSREEEELPPPYHVLYDPPPPYDCVQAENNK